MIIIVGLLASEYTQQDNNQYTQHINKDIIMGSFSITHWLILLVVVVVVFGTSKLRNAGKDLGGAVKGFKDAVKDEEAEAQGEAGREEIRLPEPSRHTSVIAVFFLRSPRSGP